MSPSLCLLLVCCRADTDYPRTPIPPGRGPYVDEEAPCFVLLRIKLERLPLKGHAKKGHTEARGTHGGMEAKGPHSKGAHAHYGKLKFSSVPDWCKHYLKLFV